MTPGQAGALLDALAALERFVVASCSEDLGVTVGGGGCGHPPEQQVDLTTMGASARRFYCRACQQTYDAGSVVEKVEG